MSTGLRVRRAGPADVRQLLGLMRELAAFECYLNEFAVTEIELRKRGFPKDGPPQFFALLVEDLLGLTVGYAVYHLVAFTFGLCPTLVLKELYVRDSHRGQGAGRRLLDRVLEDAIGRGCGKISWAVLPSNDRAKSFYRRWGGRPDTDWEYWTRPVAKRSDMM